MSQGKQVRVDIKEDRVKVEVLEDGKYVTLVDNALKWKGHPTNSIWTMVPGDHVHVNLEKIQERWWDACFIGMFVCVMSRFGAFLKEPSLKRCRFCVA